MRYVLAGLSGLTMSLLAWLIISLHGDPGTTVWLPFAVGAWTLVPFVLLAALFRACTTVGEKVMFFAGAVAVLMFYLGFLCDLAITGQYQELGMSFLNLPLYISGALLGFWILAQVVMYLYQGTPHQGGTIGWDLDTKEDT